MSTEFQFSYKTRSIGILILVSCLLLVFPQDSFAGSAVISGIPGTTCTTSNYPVTLNYAVPFTAGSSTTMTSVEVAVSATHTTTNDTLTVYASSGSNSSINMSGTSLASFSYLSKTGPYIATNNYNILSFQGSFNVVAGTTYWIAFNGSGSGFVCLDSNTSTYSNSWNWYNYNNVFYWSWFGRGTNWTVNQHMNLNIYANISVASSIQLTTNSTFAAYNSQKSITATLPIAGSDGFVTFYADNKKIPGCIKVRSITLTATCVWKPSKHGSVMITSNLIPIDSAYLPSSSAPIYLLIDRRMSTR